MATPEKSRVKIVEISKVSPLPLSSGDSSTPESLPLTFFDLRWLRLPPVQRLFFYQVSATQASFYSDILPRLKRSLSIALQHFPLSGKLIWPESSVQPILSYEDGDGVSLTVAESNGRDFSHLSGCSDKLFVEAEACHPLIPNIEKAKLLALQITLFPNEGLCIGVSYHHAVMDGKSSTSFMKSWAQISKLGQATQDLKPFCDRTVVKDPENLGETYARQWREMDLGPNNRSLETWELRPIPPSSVRATFTLTRSDLEKLRQLASNELQDDDDRFRFRLSTFCLTFAYASVCAAKAKGIESGNVLMVVTFDCRSRLNPTLPETYFGNCLGSRIIQFQDPKSLLRKDGLAVAAKAIGEAVASVADGALDGAEFWVSGLINILRTPNPSCTTFLVSGSNRFEVYGIDFGWGRPRKVDLVSIENRKSFGFSDSRDGDGGVEIGVVLQKQEMEAFASLFAQGLE